MEELKSEDRWLSVLIEAHKNSPYEEEKPLYKERRGLYLLLAGTDEGHIAVLDQTNGTILYSVKVGRCYIYCTCTCTCIIGSRVTGIVHSL